MAEPSKWTQERRTVQAARMRSQRPWEKRRRSFKHEHLADALRSLLPRVVKA